MDDAFAAPLSVVGIVSSCLYERRKLYFLLFLSVVLKGFYCHLCVLLARVCMLDVRV